MKSTTNTAALEDAIRRERAQISDRDADEFAKGARRTIHILKSFARPFGTLARARIFHLSEGDRQQRSD